MRRRRCSPRSRRSQPSKRILHSKRMRPRIRTSPARPATKPRSCMPAIPRTPGCGNSFFRSASPRCNGSMTGWGSHSICNSARATISRTLPPSSATWKAVAVESNGATCVFIEGNEAFIVRKSDGRFTYATTDLATIRYREEELHADAMLYVVDTRQAEHFNLLFATARRWGYAETEFQHVSFGTVMGEDGKPFKTRAGDTVGLESLLDEAVAKARRIVDENDDAKRDEQEQPAPELNAAERQGVAEIVGIGGIKYADLRHNRDSDYVFSWEKMLANTGDTATYMQYAYARICGIFRKGGESRDALRSARERIRPIEPAERGLALQLCRFPEALASVATEYRPNQLTQYLFETANTLSTFYEQCNVLKAPDAATRTSRLMLVDLAGRVIERGLSLLGIAVSERM